MTYNSFTEFKDDFAGVRDKTRIIRSKIKSLETLREDRLATVNSGAIDYSKERLQTSLDPDKALIYAIDEINSDAKKLIEQIERLREEIKPFEELIEKRKDVGGEILRCYYLEGLSMAATAKQLNYSEVRGWELWRKTLKAIYDEEVNR